MVELPAASGILELQAERRCDVAIDPLRLSAQRRRQGGPTWDGHSESRHAPQDQLCGTLGYSTVSHVCTRVDARPRVVSS